MSDMRKLLESMDKFAGEKAGQKPGDQVRGTDKAKKNGTKHPFAGRLVGSGAAESVEIDSDLESLRESLMQEYKYYVKDTEHEGGEDKEAGHSPVANINPASHNQQRVVDETDPNPAPGTQVPGQTAPTGTAPAQPGQAPAAGTAQPGQPPKPGQPPVAGQPAKPGQPPAKPGTPPVANPQQVSALNQLKTATGNAKLNPQKAAQAAAQAQTNPDTLNPEQKLQLQQVGQALAPEVNAANMGKIKGMLQSPQ